MQSSDTPSSNVQVGKVLCFDANSIRVLGDERSEDRMDRKWKRVCVHSVHVFALV